MNFKALLIALSLTSAIAAMNDNDLSDINDSTSTQTDYVETSPSSGK